MTTTLQEMQHPSFAQEVATLYDLKQPLTKRQLRIQDVLQQYATQRGHQNTESQRVALLNSLEKLTREVPLSSETEALSQAAHKTLINYLCADFDSRYDTISPELFTLKRTIEVNDGNKNYNISIPLFACVPFGSKEPWRERKALDSWKTISLSSAVPPYTRAVKQKAREAHALFAESYARALRAPLIGDYLLRDFKHSATGGLDLIVAWIPKPSELKMTIHERDPDPLLIGKVHGKNYLIACWDVAGEEPYEHYLWEYKNVDLT